MVAVADAEEEEEEEQPRVPVLKPVRRRILKPHSRNLPQPRASVDLAEETLQPRTWSPLRPQPTSIAFTGTPDHHVAAQPEHSLRRWRPLLQIA